MEQPWWAVPAVIALLIGVLCAVIWHWLILGVVCGVGLLALAVMGY